MDLVENAWLSLYTIPTLTQDSHEVFRYLRISTDVSRFIPHRASSIIRIVLIAIAAPDTASGGGRKCTTGDGRFNGGLLEHTCGLSAQKAATESALTAHLQPQLQHRRLEDVHVAQVFEADDPGARPQCPWE